ncbi:MFS transporter [Solihabitans fulvus]|nr:MFS transporter [Solihabitans fulvus]
MTEDDLATSGVRDAARTERPTLGRDYWRLWTSASLSSLADGILKVALPLVAIGFTRSPTAIAGLAFAFTLPWLLFALPAGAFADRLDRRRTMVAAELVRAGLLAGLVLAVLFDAGSIAALYVVAFCVGTAETVYDTSAQALAPQLVPRARLARANGWLYAAELTANQFIGPPLAGVLVTVGTLAAFVTPVALWIVALGALLLVRGRFRVPRDRSATLRADIAEGLRFLWRHRLLRTFAAMVGVFNFTTNATWAVLVLYAVGPTSAMRLTERSFGVLLTAVAVGGVVGSVIAEPAERALGRARLLGVSFLAGAALVGLPALTANPILVGVAFFVGSAGIIVSNIVMVSLRQRVTPDRLLGRVNSGYRLVAWGSRPLGAAAGGLLAQLLGLRAVFAVMGVLALAVLLWMATVTDRAMDAAEREAGHR